MQIIAEREIPAIPSKISIEICPKHRIPMLPEFPSLD